MSTKQKGCAWYEDMGCWRISLFDELASYTHSYIMSGNYLWVELGAVATSVVLKVFHTFKSTLFGMTVQLRRAEGYNFSESSILFRRHIPYSSKYSKVPKLAVITRADLKHKPIIDTRLLQETFTMTSSPAHHNLMASSDQHQIASKQDLGKMPIIQCDQPCKHSRRT